MGKYGKYLKKYSTSWEKEAALKGISQPCPRVYSRQDPIFECGYTWTIENYLSIRSESSMTSPKFSGGADGFNVDWCLELYPHGYKSIDKWKRDSTLLLRMVSCSKDAIDVKCKCSIVNRFNKKCNSRMGIMRTCGWRVWNFGSLFSGAQLMDNTEGYLVDGKLIINCNIRVGGILEHNSLPQNVVLPESSLPADFWQMYLDQKHVDVTVEVHGKDFMAHKAVLAARSPVFASMFDTNMMESNSNRVVITDIKPEVFVEFLRYVYSDKVENLKEVVCGLLACSEKYALERLKVMCEESIIANLSVENAADVLLMADLHRSERLKLQALDFIKFHPLEITQTEGWNTLMNHPQLVAEAFKSTAALVDDLNL